MRIKSNNFIPISVNNINIKRRSIYKTVKINLSKKSSQVIPQKIRVNTIVTQAEIERKLFRTMNFLTLQRDYKIIHNICEV